MAMTIKEQNDKINCPYDKTQMLYNPILWPAMFVLRGTNQFVSGQNMTLQDYWNILQNNETVYWKLK